MVRTLGKIWALRKTDKKQGDKNLDEYLKNIRIAKKFVEGKNI